MVDGVSDSVRISKRPVHGQLHVRLPTHNRHIVEGGERGSDEGGACVRVTEAGWPCVGRGGQSRPQAEDDVTFGEGEGGRVADNGDGVVPGHGVRWQLHLEEATVSRLRHGGLQRVERNHHLSAGAGLTPKLRLQRSALQDHVGTEHLRHYQQRNGMVGEDADNHQRDNHHRP